MASVAEVLDRYDDEELARMFGLARVAAGAAAFFAPRRSSWFWGGRRAQQPESVMPIRGLGGRDLAIGLCLLIALDKGAPARGWLEAGAMADASDLFALLRGWSQVPPVRRLGFVGTAGSAMCFGLLLASRLDD